LDGRPTEDVLLPARSYGSLYERPFKQLDLASPNDEEPQLSNATQKDQLDEAARLLLRVRDNLRSAISPLSNGGRADIARAVQRLRGQIEDVLGCISGEREVDDAPGVYQWPQ
jgi:hypothetical protein